MALQTFLWLVLSGVFASTVVIVVVFIIINKCMRWKAAKYDAMSKNPTKSSYELSNSYKQNGQEDIRPPLPPRDQFDTESLTNSYEDVHDIPVVEVETSLLQNPDHSRPPDTHVNFLDNTSASESYDDVDALQNVTNSYEDVHDIPVVEVETSLLQNPDHSRPPDTHVNFLDNSSASESYDDVDALQNVTNSYEDVHEIPVVEVETSSLQNPDHSRPPDTHVNFLDNSSASESYDDVDALQNVQGSYEEVALLPDYREVDLPSFQSESDNGSENYDDVDQLHGDNEDYDDVG